MRFFNFLRPKKDKDFFIRVVRWFFPGNSFFGYPMQLFFIAPFYKLLSSFSHSAVKFSSFCLLVR